MDDKKLLRLGAEAWLKQLEEEAAELRRRFPSLGKTAANPSSDAAESDANETAATHQRRSGKKRTRRRKRTLSEQARKAVSERMTRYWAERRKAKKRG